MCLLKNWMYEVSLFSQICYAGTHKLTIIYTRVFVVGINHCCYIFWIAFTVSSELTSHIEAQIASKVLTNAPVECKSVDEYCHLRKQAVHICTVSTIIISAKYMNTSSLCLQFNRLTIILKIWTSKLLQVWEKVQLWSMILMLSAAFGNSWYNYRQTQS